MKSGLLWYDASQNTIDVKIQQAAKRYQEKFGAAPNLAFVNPKDIKDPAVRVLNITIKTKETIMPNHVWLGISN